MNEEKKESNEIESNESESNGKTRARDPRKGQAIQDASEWERKIKEAMMKAEENKKQKM